MKIQTCLIFVATSLFLACNIVDEDTKCAGEIFLAMSAKYPCGKVKVGLMNIKDTDKALKATTIINVINTRVEFCSDSLDLGDTRVVKEMAGFALSKYDGSLKIDSVYVEVYDGSSSILHSFHVDELSP